MMVSLPLAAGGADVIFPLIFGLISFVAWIVNTVKKNQEEQARRSAGPKRQKDQKVRLEIEEFLQQQQSGRPSRPATVYVDPADIEVVDESSGRRSSPVVQPKKTPKQNRKPASSAPKSAKPTAPPPTVSSTASRPGMGQMSHAPLGSELREHVSKVMGERVKAQAERDLPHLASTMAAKVQEDLGDFSVSKKALDASSTASPLIQVLRNPQTARQAVLMAEIMGRPKALRK